MPNWPWIERTFNFDFPASKFPDLLERVRGTPVRVEALVKGLSHDVLTRSPGSGWSIQENVGHLIDLGYLALQRVGEILTGKDVLVAADMTNRKTNEANHNARNMELVEASGDERIKERFQRVRIDRCRRLTGCCRAGLRMVLRCLRYTY